LFRRADLVFTGGHSLYEAKRGNHRNVYAFPSSVDADHFAQARHAQPDPDDQQQIPHPRLGFYGVIDERMDLDLLEAVADLRPEWQFVMIGPVVKIDAASLPRRANIHYLGARGYADLPWYLAGWDAAIMPFAHNEATRFISPTKTLEYLAAGRPVISTSIRDVVAPYARQGLVRIADTPLDFSNAIERALGEDPAPRLRAVDTFLTTTSWQRTWREMQALIEAVIELRLPTVVALPPSPTARVPVYRGSTKHTSGRLLAFRHAGAQVALSGTAHEEAE
jgi:UDP-galactopyranose mutase